MSTKTKKLAETARQCSQVKRGPKAFFSNNAFVLLAFAIPFLIMLINFAMKKFLPFGDQQIMVVDLWHQYYPFLVDFQDKLISGQSMLYSWSNGMGGNYLALMSYYVASPINFLTAFIPADFLREFLMLSVCVEVGCASGFMAIFLKKAFHKNGLSLTIFSVGYGCCAFFMGYYWNVIWLNTVAMLPLVALGMLLLWRENKFCLFTISLALSVIANYYVGLFACIFVFLCFIGYSISYWNGVKDFLARLLRTGIFSGISLMITAFLTLPAFNALQLTYSTNNTWPDYWRFYYSWSEIMSQSLDFIPPSTKENLPNIACGVAAIFFGILFLTTRKVNKRVKAFSVGLLALLVLSFNCNVLDYVWHGMHFTNMIPHRFAYLFSFVLLVMAYRAYTLIDKASIWDVIIALCGSLMFVLISVRVQGGAPLWGSAIIMSIIGVACILYVFKIYPKIVLDFVVFTLVLVEMFVAGYNGIKAVGSTGITNYPEGEATTADVVKAMYKLEANTTDMWRAEMVSTQTLNDSSFNDFNGISQFSSMSNVSVTKFLEEFGCQGWQSGNRYTYRESTPITNLFLNVKYLISRNGSYAASKYVSPCYKVDAQTKEDGTSTPTEVLLKNNYYLPMGFVTNKDLLDYTLEERDPDDFSNLNTIEKQNEFFRLATGVDEDVMTIIEPIGSNTSAGNSGDIVTINKQFPDSIHGYDFNINLSATTEPTTVDFVYSVDETADYAVYAAYYATGLETKALTVKKDGASVKNDGDIGRPYIMNVGQFEQGQQLTVSLENLQAGANTNFICYVAKVNDDVFEKGYNNLKQSALTATKVTDTEISGQIDCRNDGLFYTSVVYEDGWSVTVDGEKVKTDKVGGAMLAFPITAGAHTVVMKYTPSGYVVGTFASLLGIFLLIAAAFLYRNYLSKTFIFKYKTHPDANPDRVDEDDEDDGDDNTTDGLCDDTVFSEEKRKDYPNSASPLFAKIFFSVVFSVVYLAVWFAGIIKKIKFLAKERPEYAADVTLSVIVPFYFVYAAYKYAKQKESLAEKAKVRAMTTFSHTALALGSSCSIFVSLVTFISAIVPNYEQYKNIIETNKQIAQTGGTPQEMTVSILPQGFSMVIFVMCIILSVVLKIVNLYYFDKDISSIAESADPLSKFKKKA